MLPAYHAYTDFKVDLDKGLRQICYGSPVIDFYRDEHTPVLRIECIVPPQIPYDQFNGSTEVVECLIHDICEKHNIWYHMSTHTASDIVWQHGILWNVGVTLSISHQQI